jgi:hypothetical protein
MSDLRIDPKFHQSKVSQVLPPFFQEEYPLFVSFLETYYDFEKEESVDHIIKNLIDIRNISTTDLEYLDLLLGEISDGLDTDSFDQNVNADPRFMTRLLSRFYRSKGTQLSAEQFFKAFYGVDIEVTYPKKNIFKLNDKPNGSLIGPSSLKYIQDDRRYQIFSVLLKTPLSFSDYEAMYKKMVHPAGFYLAGETETQGFSDLNVMAGQTTDPLEIPNYPVVLETTQSGSLAPTYSLLVMEENDPVDARTQAQKDDGTGIIISSLETLDKYDTITLQQLSDDFGTVGEWAGVKPPTLDDGTLDLSQTYENLDAEEHGG